MEMDPIFDENENEKVQDVNLDDIFGGLDSLLSSTDLKDVTSEGAGFEELPEGYYLSEVEKAELTTSKTSQQPMVKFQLSVVEDGKMLNEEGMLENISKVKGRKIFMYYVLKDDSSVKRFVTDMLKFEGEEEGVSLLDKECFTRSELLTDALNILQGSRIYIHVEKVENKDGTTSTWNRMISWKKATMLGVNE